MPVPCRAMLVQRGLVTILIIVLPGLMLAPVWQLGGLGAGEDDVLYYFPSRVFFHETITAGQWPWLNPYVGADRPFAADPQSALWYPTTWLFAVLPPLWAYPLGLWLHYSLAHWGMYRLLRAQGLDRLAACFGGLVFAYSGFLLSHRAHFTMQHAAAWTPWVFWRVRRFTQTADDPAASGRRLLWAAAAAAGLCFAGHVQIAALAALGTFVFILADGSRLTPAQGGAHASASGRVLRWLIVWVCAAGLFAVQWLPTLDYLRLCTRVERTFLDFVEQSWNPLSAIGLVLPMFFGQRTPNFFDQPYWGPSHQCEQFAYIGLLPLILAALALRGGWQGDSRKRPWVILLIFAALLALGKFGPVCPLLYWLPGSSLFRVPARALVLCHLAIAALAAATLHDLGPVRHPAQARLRYHAGKWARRPWLKALLMVGAPALAALLIAVWLPPALRAAALAALQPTDPALWMPLLIALGTLAGLLFVVRAFQQPRLRTLLIAVVALDLGVIGWHLDVPAQVDSAEHLLPDADAAWIELVRQSHERLWTVTSTSGVYANPAQKLSPNTNSLAHVFSLGDYGPLQPRNFVKFFNFRPWGVTHEAPALLQDPAWMRTFNVGWILLAHTDLPPPAGAAAYGATPAGFTLYRNPTAAGMAFFADAAQPGFVRYVPSGPASFRLTLDSWPGADPGTDEVAPVRVIVSRLALPGWHAAVNGEPLRVEEAYRTLLAFSLADGEAFRIDCWYFPPGLIEGIVLSGATAVLLLVFALWPVRASAAAQQTLHSAS